MLANKVVVVIALCCVVQNSAEASGTRGMKQSSVTAHRQQIEIGSAADPKPMDMINKFRAEVCAKLKDEHGKNFESYTECMKFMEDACHPGKDHKMDGDGKEITSGEGFCQEYFKEKKREKKVVEEHKVSAPVPAPSPAQAPAPAPEPEKKLPAPAPAPAAANVTKPTGPAPAPASAPGPAPGPSPGPFTPGISGGKPPSMKDDEKYYYKKGGKDASRLHMDEKLKLPAEGYWGKLVEHEDQKTVTGDWGTEFGPGHGTYAEICKEHPESGWCTRHGHHKHSSGQKASIHLIAFMAPLGFLGLAMA